MSEEREEETVESPYMAPPVPGKRNWYDDHPSRGRRRNWKQEGLSEEPIEFFEHELVFIEVYCANLNLPDSLRLKKAATEAGYKGINSGWKLIRKPHIARAIYDRLRFEKLAAPEIVEKLGRVIRADIKQYMRVVPQYEVTEEADEATGEMKEVRTFMRDEVVVDLSRAIREDDTYAIKSIEFYRTGEVKRIALEDRLEAMKMLGAVYGLFGNKQLGDDENRPWWERAREKGYDPKQVIEEMLSIAKSMGQEIPKELIEGRVKETVSPNGEITWEFPEPKDISDEEDE